MYADEVLADTPTGYWHLGEFSGTVIAADEISTNDGTYVSEPTPVPGLLPAESDIAKLFTAAQAQEVTLPGNVLSTNGTLEYWFAWTAGTTLLRDHSSSSGGWVCGFDDSGTFAVRVASGTNIGTSKTTNELRNGLVHHFVLTKEGPDLIVYLDDQVIATDGAAANVASLSPWHIGRNGTIGQYSDVIIDEVAIYDYPLSPARVSVHHDVGRATASLVYLADDNPSTSAWEFDFDAADDAWLTQDGIFLLGTSIGGLTLDPGAAVNVPTVGQLWPR